MLLKFSLNNSNQMKIWDQFVLLHPQSTPFHTSNWLKTLQKTYNYLPLLYISYDHDKNLDGILPCFHIKSFITGNRLVSIPFSDYGGSLFYDSSKENQLLLNIIDNANGRLKYVELRSALDHNSRFSFHNQYKFHTLQLCPQPERLIRNINKRTTRYSIDKAIKAGVRIKEENTLQGIESFYRLNVMTRKKHGLPPQPIEFFKNIYKNMILNRNAFLLLAIYDSKAIGAGIFIKFKDTVYYKYNASNPSYLSQKTPNHLLTWHAIKQACLQGFQTFDFGRTSSVNNGLSKHKEMWGAKPFNLSYSFYTLKNKMFYIHENDLFYRFFSKVCRHLPEKLLEKLGTRIYRHVG